MIKGILFFIFVNLSAYSAQEINFTDLKKASESTTAQFAFKESKNISANFNINQNDKELEPYFDSNKKSQLCGPTTLAQLLIYNMGVTHKLPISEKVPGVSSDLKTIDANKLIVELAKRCKTNFETGTSFNDIVVCLNDISKDYFDKKVTVVKINNNNASTYPDYVTVIDRKPSVGDIKNALVANQPIVASVGWNVFDPATKKWIKKNGHIFGIYGFNWQSYFADNSLQLIVMNPRYNWEISKNSSNFDIVSALKLDNFNSDSLFLDGRGFNGQEERGFLSSLLIIDFI